MDDGVFLFKKTNIDKSFIEEIFSYDVNKLESTDSVEISKYSIALGQYLIYFKSQVNKVKANLHRKQRNFEGTISAKMNDSQFKDFKTKSAIREHLIQNSSTIRNDYEELEKLREELMLVEGVDRTVSEMIATFKRELTRRENELWQTKQERK
jgi:hypothetical protein